MTSGIAMPSARTAHRKLSDYCGIFAEKTNKIGRNVGSFIQSRGLLPIRHSLDETSRNDAISRSNGDVTRNNDVARGDRTIRDGHHYNYEYHNYEYPNKNKQRSIYSNNTYPQQASANARYFHHFNETEPQHSRRCDYTLDYHDRDIRRDSSRNRSVSKPILRNGMNRTSDERQYYSTLPRRSRAINFKDQTYYSLEERRKYPKSLRDLTDLELDDIMYHSSPTTTRNYHERRLVDDHCRRSPTQENELSSDDDYFKFCRNLSSLDKYPQGSRYAPGQVHYEREFRTFGKDTMAFIYYKTCYL